MTKMVCRPKKWIKLVCRSIKPAWLKVAGQSDGTDRNWICGVNSASGAKLCRKHEVNASCHVRTDCSVRDYYINSTTAGEKGE